MEFYNRKKELEILENHWTNLKGIIIDVVFGRRRIGKTELAKKFIAKKPHFYFFVNRKPINSLLAEWSEIIKEEYGEVGIFDDLGKFIEAVITIMDKKGGGVLVFDEFQNFKYIYPAAFSIFQQKLDKYKKTKKVQIIFIGSVLTLMNKVFLSSKEPLFGRATGKIHLQDFDFKLIAKILKKELKTRDIEQVFNIYGVFDGIPKYYSLLEEEFGSSGSGLKFDEVVRRMFFSESAILREEGYFLLKEEFGKNFERYFEILLLIATGYRRASEIAEKIKLPVSTVSVYLIRLENNYKFTEKRKPVLSGKKERNGRYFLKDIFLIFWFKYVFKNATILEMGAGDKIAKKVINDFSTFSGPILEKIFLRIFITDDIILKKYGINMEIDEIGQYWDRKGKFDIDLAAIDKTNSSVLIGECKLNNKRINIREIKKLEEKGNLDIFKNYKNKYLFFLTLKKPTMKLRKELKAQKIDIISLEEIIY